MVLTCLSTGIIGLAYLLTLLYVTTNGYAAFNGVCNLVAFNVFYLVGGDIYGSIMTWFMFFNFFITGMTSCTVTARIAFALLRDEVFPNSKKYTEVDPKTASPVSAVICCFIFDAVLLVLPLASQKVYGSILGITALSYNISYLIPIMTKLVFEWDTFPQTTFSLGTYSNTLNIISCIWLIFACICLIIPRLYPITPNNMNYSFLVIFAIASLASIHWKWYAGENYHGAGKLDKRLRDFMRGKQYKKSPVRETFDSYNDEQTPILHRVGSHDPNDYTFPSTHDVTGMKDEDFDSHLEDQHHETWYTAKADVLDSTNDTKSVESDSYSEVSLYSLQNGSSAEVYDEEDPQFYATRESISDIDSPIDESCIEYYHPNFETAHEFERDILVTTDE